MRISIPSSLHFQDETLNPRQFLPRAGGGLHRRALRRYLAEEPRVHLPQDQGVPREVGRHGDSGRPWGVVVPGRP